MAQFMGYRVQKSLGIGQLRIDDYGSVADDLIVANTKGSELGCVPPGSIKNRPPHDGKAVLTKELLRCAPLVFELYSRTG